MIYLIRCAQPPLEASLVLSSTFKVYVFLNDFNNFNKVFSGFKLKYLLCATSGRRGISDATKTLLSKIVKKLQKI